MEVCQVKPLGCQVMSISFVTRWAVAHQGPLSISFSRQEYWSGSPFPPPGDLHNPGIKPGSPTLQVDSLPSEPQGKPKVLTGIFIPSVNIHITTLLTYLVFLDQLI